MKRMLTYLAIGVALTGSAYGSNPSALRNAADVTQRTFVEGRAGVPFELECTVLLDSPAGQPDISVEDTTGATILRKEPVDTNLFFRAGDRLHVHGLTAELSNGYLRATLASVKTIGHTTARHPAEATVAEIESGRLDCRPVRISGTIVDFFRDELDDTYAQLVIDCGGENLFAACRGYDTSRLRVSTRMSAVGIVFPGSYNNRRFRGRTLGIDNPAAIVLSDNHPSDPFAVPALNETTLLNPAAIQALGRRKTSGTVLAVWGRRLLLKTTGRWPVMVDIAHQPMPDCGRPIEVSGLADTDLFQLCLCRATWRTDEAPLPGGTSAEEIEIGDSPLPQHVGHAVRIKGAVFGMPNGPYGNGTLLVKCGARLLPVDASAHPGFLNDLSVGCTVAVAGICVLEAEHWRPNAVSPHILGFRIVPRRADDIRVTARPPWWTAGRLLAVIGTLFATLFVLALWNVTLKRLVSIKSRELADGEITRAEAAIKVYERTRLAVELHDSVAQSLTGVSMEIRAAQKAEKTNPNGLAQHLNMATLTLESCRSDLRDCLWDLRNLTLDEDSMEDAIRKTLIPRLDGAELAIRFNVDRERLTDNTAHTILRILRELTANAVRHGRATVIRVAGSLDENRLLFSVRDNGCGFDPQTAPSMAQGHFGLQGIRDRINLLGGTLEISSVPNKGTHVTVTLNLPKELENA